MPHPTNPPTRPALVPARWQLLLHALAAMSLGIMAGFFWTYSANVNLAMQQMDASTYATVQSAFNRNVRHWLFFLFFFGTPGWCLLALASAWGQRSRGWWRSLAGATVLYVLGIIFFTQQVNLPLNHTTEAWNPQAVPEGWTQVRDQWNSANLWRTLANGVAFGTAVLALAARAVAMPAIGAQHRASP
jgi:uncharacterized membrane protein